MQRRYFTGVLTALMLLLTACTGTGTQPAATVPNDTTQAVETTIPPTEPDTSVSAFTVTEALVYAGPSTDSEVLDTLQNRTNVQITAVIDDGQWSIVRYGDRLGYIPSTMLRNRVEGKNGYLVVIDAGHQRKANPSPSPVGPGSSTTKYSVSGGTMGQFTGIPEYELNLAVSKMLEDILLERGYEVIMVRVSHDVDITNIERAAVANESYADAFIRIHANGSTNPDEQGAMTICMTEENPYNAHLFDRSYALSDAILDAMVENTGCVREGIWKTDTMSGINWSQVPVTIVEMGYMTNEEEDFLLATDEYRMFMAEGIANGIDRYFSELNN